MYPTYKQTGTVEYVEHTQPNGETSLVVKISWSALDRGTFEASAPFWMMRMIQTEWCDNCVNEWIGDLFDFPSVEDYRFYLLDQTRLFKYAYVAASVWDHWNDSDRLLPYYCCGSHERGAFGGTTSS